MQHANLPAQIFLPLFSLIIVTAILTARKRQLFIRRITGLNALEEAIGRATEMGRPMVGITGLGGIDIVTLQALSIVTYVVKKAARYGARMIAPVNDTTFLPVAQEAIRDAYTMGGRPDLYNSEDVPFLSNRQFSFAASVAGMILREKAAACFFFGSFYAEALIFAEAGQQVGAIQVAGTPQTLQIPFFIASCDYVIIGDEYYAAGAYLSREPTAMGSIVGQDICKLMLFLTIVAGAISVLFPPFAHSLAQWLMQK